MIKLEFYVPLDSADSVKEALFAAGAGRIGRYERCSWETEGLGQFRGDEESRPAVGTAGKIEKVRELKVEMVLEDRLLDNAVAVLREAHPYEEPVFAAWKVESGMTAE